MTGTDETAFQRFIAKVIEILPKTRNYYDRQIQERLGTTGKPIYDVQRKGGEPKRETLRAMANVLGQPLDLMLRAIEGEEVDPVVPGEPKDGTRTPSSSPYQQPSRDLDAMEMVGIQNIDQAFGLGAAFTDSPVEIEVLHFPKVWVDSITATPAELLTWARARGDSMETTIGDGDLVLLDRSQRRVDEQDAIWAFTMGDVASIKRLRVKGDRFQILSDNPLVSDDEEPIDFINIVARVIFVGKRK